MSNLNEINYERKVCILLVFLTYVYHDTRFREYNIFILIISLLYYLFTLPFNLLLSLLLPGC